MIDMEKVKENRKREKKLIFDYIHKIIIRSKSKKNKKKIKKMQTKY